MTVTVVTPSLPERASRLAEAVASVAAQTVRPAGHLISIDLQRLGPVALRNRMVQGVDTEWVAFLDDDDLLYPHHLETLLGASDDVDVVYSFCDVTGRGDWSPNMDFNERALRSFNFIPVTAMVRRSAFLAVGGFPEGTHPVEDWRLWLALLDAGARFRCVPVKTWLYRFHDANATSVVSRTG